MDGELILDREEELQYAQYFTMTHYKGGYKQVSAVTTDEDLDKTAAIVYYK